MSESPVQPTEASGVEVDLLDLPIILLRETVVFPESVIPLQVGRPVSLNAVEAAAEGRRVFLLAQRTRDEVPRADELYSVGTVATIMQILRMPEGGLQVLVNGERRGTLREILQMEPYWIGRVAVVEEPPIPKTLEAQALVRMVHSDIDRFVKINPNVPEDVVAAVKSVHEPGRLADLLGFAPEFTFEQRQSILETFDPGKRIRMASSFFARVVELADIRGKIHSEVHKGFEKTQRDYQLREQLKAIQRELGQSDPEAAVVADLRAKIEAAGMTDEVRERALREVERLSQIPFASPETAVIRTYVDWLGSLPWAIETPDRLDLAEVERVLEEDHYGLRRVKERILEYIAVRKLAERPRSPILCFVGPPGVGKTSLGRSIARALERRFVRLSLGGIRDEAEIRGHRRTYVGALPGQIIQGVRTAGSKNPVFMLDEIDKIGIDFRGDPSAALLEVLDPDQNYQFSDHYLEVPFDLSRVFFICTANVVFTIPPALRDRMEMIELAGYIEEEKLHIARRFLVPRQLEQHGLAPHQLTFSDGALRAIIRDYTKEAGVRNLEREIARICRKVTWRIAEGQEKPTKITSANLDAYLGPARHFAGSKEDHDEIGVATGLAWTETGGDLISVETTLMKGRGNLILTGHLGDVMQESARAAVSYARTRAKELGLPAKFFEEHTIHIHVPAGAIPKDGPSAGVTMTIALLSALSHRPVRRDAAMTGEVTLRGHVLPVGGLKEKAMAAHRAGITTLIAPAKNKKDLTEIPSRVLRDLRFVFVNRIAEVIPEVLLPPAVESAAA